MSNEATEVKTNTDEAAPVEPIVRFTAIYIETWQSGSHWHSLTKMKRLEREEWQTVADMLNDAGIADTCQYLFHGWPKMQGEE